MFDRCTSSLAAAASLVMAVGCAGTHPPSKELADARQAYQHAAAGPASQLAPVQLHLAEDALAHAEEAHKNCPKADKSIDLAYLALRKSELADTLGSSELAKQQTAETEKAYNDGQAMLAQHAEEELAKMRLALQDAQRETAAALSKFADLKQAVKAEDRGVVITLSGNILFASNKAVLLPAARAKLEEVAKAISASQAKKVVIEGHCDASGKASLNADLAQKRADAVAKFLASKGLAADIMQVEGIGAARPLASNDTAEGRATNRRVEIIVQGPAAKS